MSPSRLVRFAAASLLSSLLPPLASAQVDGSLDPAYGSPSDPGRMAFAIVSRDPAETPGAPDWAQVTPFEVLPRGDGSAIVWSNAATPYDLPISTPSVPVAVRILADGTWDPSWGASGGGRTVIYVGEDYAWRANDAVSTPDGGMAVVGTIDNPDGSSDMAVWKFTANGLADMAFGSGGVRRLRRGGLPSDAGKTVQLADLDLVGNGIPVPDLLIVGGNLRDGFAGPHGLALAILDLNGNLCPSSIPACGNVVGGDVGLASEWRLLRIGTGLCPNGADIDVVDLTKFDAGVGDAIPVLIRGCGDTAVVKHTIIGNVGGNVWGGTVNPAYANDGRSLVTFGPGFLVDGNAIVHAPLRDLPLGNESLVIAGFRAQPDRTQPLILAARLGRTAFDAVIYDADPPADPWLSPGAYADTVLVQPDGKLILGGGTAFSSWTFGDALLMRLNADLTPDASFGNLSASLPERQVYGYPIGGTDRDNRVNATALTPRRQAAVRRLRLCEQRRQRALRLGHARAARRRPPVRERVRRAVTDRRRTSQQVLKFREIFRQYRQAARALLSARRNDGFARRSPESAATWTIVSIDRVSAQLPCSPFLQAHSCVLQRDEERHGEPVRRPPGQLRTLPARERIHRTVLRGIPREPSRHRADVREDRFPSAAARVAARHLDRDLACRRHGDGPARRRRDGAGAFAPGAHAGAAVAVCLLDRQPSRRRAREGPASDAGPARALARRDERDGRQLHGGLLSRRTQRRSDTARGRITAAPTHRAPPRTRDPTPRRATDRR